MTNPQGLLPDELSLVLTCLSNRLPDFSHDLLQGDWSIERLHRRNRNYVIRAQDGRGYFVKVGAGTDHAATLLREATVLQHLGAAWTEPRRSPELLFWDAQHSVLGTRLLPNARALSSVYGAKARFRTAVAHDLGQALASLHRAPVPEMHAFVRPWVLSIHRPGTEELAELSGAMLTFVRLLQEQPEIGSALDYLNQVWRVSALTHGDLKLDNLVLARTRDARAQRVFITDWETAGPGDPRADVGAVLAQYLQIWVQSIANPRDLATHSQRASTRFTINRLRPSIQAFVYSYHANMNCSYEDVTIAVQLSGARLLQFLYEMHRNSPDFHDQSVLQLQLAANLLTRPEEAAVKLLEISL